MEMCDEGGQRLVHRRVNSQGGRQRHVAGDHSLRVAVRGVQCNEQTAARGQRQRDAVASRHLIHAGHAHQGLCYLRAEEKRYGVRGGQGEEVRARLREVRR